MNDPMIPVMVRNYEDFFWSYPSIEGSQTRRWILEVQDPSAKEHDGEVVLDQFPSRRIDAVFPATFSREMVAAIATAVTPLLLGSQWEFLKVVDEPEGFDPDAF